jgi:hypothetical protein
MATTLYRPSSSSTGDVSITGDITASGTINTVGISSAANATAMTITSDEDIGVGIAVPDGRLHVHTASAGSVTPAPEADDFVVENSADGGISVLVPDASKASVYLGSPTDPSGGLISWEQSIGRMRVGTFHAGYLALYSGNGTEALRIDASQNIIIKSDTLRVETQKTPASAAATGTKGDLVHDTGFIYVCTATDTWKRVAIATW